MHRELEWPVSKATCSYRSLYTMYRNLYTVIEGTRPSATQYAETRAADRAARYAARANRANAPPQQHHLAQGIALDN